MRCLFSFLTFWVLCHRILCTAPAAPFLVLGWHSHFGIPTFRKHTTSYCTIPSYGSRNLLLKKPLPVGCTPSYNQPYSNVTVMLKKRTGLDLHFSIKQILFTCGNTKKCNREEKMWYPWNHEMFSNDQILRTDGCSWFLLKLPICCAKLGSQCSIRSPLWVTVIFYVTSN